MREELAFPNRSYVPTCQPLFSPLHRLLGPQNNPVMGAPVSSPFSGRAVGDTEKWHNTFKAPELASVRARTQMGAAWFPRPDSGPPCCVVAARERVGGKGLPRAQNPVVISKTDRAVSGFPSVVSLKVWKRSVGMSCSYCIDEKTGTELTPQIHPGACRLALPRLARRTPAKYAALRTPWRSGGTCRAGGLFSPPHPPQIFSLWPHPQTCSRAGLGWYFLFQQTCSLTPSWAWPHSGSQIRRLPAVRSLKLSRHQLQSLLTLTRGRGGNRGVTSCHLLWESVGGGGEASCRGRQELGLQVGFQWQMRGRQVGF